MLFSAPTSHLPILTGASILGHALKVGRRGRGEDSCLRYVMRCQGSSGLWAGHDNTILIDLRRWKPARATMFLRHDPATRMRMHIAEIHAKSPIASPSLRILVRISFGWSIWDILVSVPEMGCIRSYGLSGSSKHRWPHRSRNEGICCTRILRLSLMEGCSRPASSCRSIGAQVIIMMMPRHFSYTHTCRYVYIYIYTYIYMYILVHIYVCVCIEERAVVSAIPKSSSKRLTGPMTRMPLSG